MKDELRIRFRALRDAMGAQRRAEASEDVRGHLERMDRYRRAGTVLFYASFGSEVGTHELMEAARTAGKRVALPRMEGKGLVLHEWSGSPPLVVHRFGVPEPPRALPEVDPKAVDVALVPGLAFDRRGVRLGYGGGYYDRLLRTATDTYRIGLGFEVQVVPKLPSMDWDVALDAIVTEAGVYEAKTKPS